jgi:hypothetical protein
LPGYTAFSPQDAFAAATRLLSQGPIRLKDVFAAGGNGQIVVSSADELHAALTQLTAHARSKWAIVVEINLQEIITYSVGHVSVDGMTVSYWGTQRTAHDNSGRVVYGGSDLHIVRGGFDDAAAIAPTAEARRAVEVARAFDSAVLAHYPEIFASRRNYDVGQGHDANGIFRCGVLDQSWRIGGSSGPEILALRLYKQHPEVRFVRASSFNVYGTRAVAPAGAIVHFHAVDREFGPLLMYTTIECVQ